MSWVKTYEAFIWESGKVDPEVEKLEKLLKFPSNSGVFQSVLYDDVEKMLVIEQPTNIGTMDAGAVLSAINKDKSKLKSAYKGLRKVMIDDLQITV
jgi:hypothetical protein